MTSLLVAHGEVATTLRLQQTQSANFTAVRNSSYPLNSTAGSFTMYLPTGTERFPNVKVKTVDYASTFDLNPVTVNAGGAPIRGQVADYLLNQKDRGRTFTWIDDVKGWLVE